MTTPIANLTDFIDTIKEKLTDGEYIQGMNLCKKVFDRKVSDKKLYTMTYLAPYMFMDEHCESDDCDDMKYCISFERKTALVLLTDTRAGRIRETNMFLGEEAEMKTFIDVDLFKSFPNDVEELGTNVEWYEFPVLKLDLASDSEDGLTGLLDTQRLVHQQEDEDGEESGEDGGQ
jgi:hypothetical protein